MSDNKPTPTPSKNRIVKAAELVKLEPHKVEINYMASALVQANLPHSDPGLETVIWGRKNGNVTLAIKAGSDYDHATRTAKNVGLPYGTIPRLLLFWLTTEAVRTKCRRIELGRSLTHFLAQLGMESTGGSNGSVGRIRKQMDRLFRSQISFTSSDVGRKAWLDMPVAPTGELWWDPKSPNRDALWSSWIELGEHFYKAILASPVPLDMRVLRALKSSPMALDLYGWLSHRFYNLQGKSVFIPWRSIAEQVGADYSRLNNFTAKATGALTKIQAILPEWKIEQVKGGLKLSPSPRAIKARSKPKELSE